MVSKLILLKLFLYLNISFFNSALEGTAQLNLRALFGQVSCICFVIHILVGILSPTLLTTAKFHLLQLIKNLPWNFRLNVILFTHGTWRHRNRRTLKISIILTTVILHACLAVYLITGSTHTSWQSY
jgi:hypothetical protein